MDLEEEAFDSLAFAMLQIGPQSQGLCLPAL